jgi:pimeloyl-ACP methyl ester carboxylesterase
VTGLVPPSLVQALLTVFFQLTLPRRVARVIIPFRFNHDVFEQSLRLAGGIRYSDLLQRYDKPVMIVNGAFDLLFRRDERAYADAAGARLVHMKRCDHVAPLREPEAFSELVREFGRQVFGAATPGTTGAGRMT